MICEFCGRVMVCDISPESMRAYHCECGKEVYFRRGGRRIWKSR